MQYLGEIISLGVAMSWTVTALVSEVATKRMGVFTLNVWRLAVAGILTGLMMLYFTGDFFPVYAGGKAWFWLLMSGFVGYFFGDYCLFNSYLTIGSRYGQLFMTLAPAAAALSAWMVMGQTMSWMSVLAMLITMFGIGISILGKSGDDDKHKRFSLQLPWKGVLFGIGAGVGQGLGLVLSKIGMDYYAQDIPAEILPQMEQYLPFSANMIRCIAGVVCFVIVMWIHQGWGRFRESVHDVKGLSAMMAAVLFGPFLGVGFSLMALTPIFILVPSYYLFKTPITFRGVLGAVISVIGASLFFV